MTARPMNNDDEAQSIPAPPSNDVEAQSIPAPPAALKRLSSLPLPAYRFVPGRHPHPTRSPDGHGVEAAAEHQELLVVAIGGSVTTRTVGAGAGTTGAARDRASAVR